MEEPIKEESTEETEITAEPTSTTTEQPAGDSILDRYSFLDTMKDEHEQAQVIEKPGIVEEPIKPDEATKETAPEFIYNDKKVKYKHGDKELELTEFEFADGTIGFIPESQKSGYLMQKDYTVKTTALATERQDLTKEKQDIEAQKQSLERFQYVKQLGTPPLIPIHDPLGELETENGGELMKDGKPTGKVVYTNASDFMDAKERADTYTRDYEKLNITKSDVKAKNLQMLEEFSKEHGKETFGKVWNKTLEFITPAIFDELSPLPKEAIELIHRGMEFDKLKSDLEAKHKAEINDAVLAKVKELEGKNKTAKIPASQNLDTKDTATHERYAWTNKYN